MQAFIFQNFEIFDACLYFATLLWSSSNGFLLDKGYIILAPGKGLISGLPRQYVLDG